MLIKLLGVNNSLKYTSFWFKDCIFFNSCSTKFKLDKFLKFEAPNARSFPFGFLTYSKGVNDSDGVIAYEYFSPKKEFPLFNAAKGTACRPLSTEINNVVILFSFKIGSIFERNSSYNFLDGEFGLSIFKSFWEIKVLLRFLRYFLKLEVESSTRLPTMSFSGRINVISR